MKLKVTFRGFPWQIIPEFWANNLDKTTGERYGWNPLKVKGMGRFGGGWAFKLGITVSESLFVMGAAYLLYRAQRLAETRSTTPLQPEKR